MTAHLVHKEILDQIVSHRFLILTGVGALIIWLSLCRGYTHYQSQLRDYHTAEVVKAGRLKQLAVADSWDELGLVGFSEHKPPVPTSIFISGLEPFLGRSISTSFGIRRPRRSSVEVEPAVGVFPFLDLGLAVQVVFSLMGLLLTFDAVCGEKERGTLSLTTSFPVSRYQVLLSKFLGALIPTLVAFGLPLLVGIAVLVAAGVQIGTVEWVRTLLVLAIAVLFLSAFVCAGLLTSCLTHHSATSFVMVLALWIAAVVVLPRSSLIVAEGLRPAPSLHEYQAGRRAISLKYLQEWRDARNRWHSEHSTPGKEFWRTMDGREAERLMHARTRDEIRPKIEAEQTRFDEAFENRYAARLDLAVTLARLSPVFAFRHAAIRLAGTGIERHRRFQRSFARDYAEGEYAAWYSKAQDLNVLRWANPTKYGPRRWDISDMPRFSYTEIWPKEDIRAALADVGVIVVWALTFFAGAFFACLRYDPR